MENLTALLTEIQQAVTARDENEKLKLEINHLNTIHAATVKGLSDELNRANNTIKTLEAEKKTLSERIAVLEKPVHPVVPQPPVVKESREPFRITKGGVYQNLHIRSAKSEVACIEIATAEFVEITNCSFELAGYGIKNHSDKTNLLVHNCSFAALPHTGNTSSPRRCLSVNNVIALTVTNNTAEGCGFVTTNGNGQQGGKISILYNDVKNVNGLMLKTVNGIKEESRAHANFVQVMNYKAVEAEIAYNRVVNEYGSSDVEDNVNVYNSRGTAANPIKIHHNRISGAFYHPTQEAKKYYSGGGIITDGDGDYSTAPAYIEIFSNVVTETGNYGIGFAAGHHLKASDNTVINAGQLPDGRSYHAIPSMNTSGIWSNPQSTRQGAMDNNVFENNTVGVNYYDKRNDISIMKGATATGTRHLPSVTKADEVKAILEWEHQHKDIKIGNL
ncbi:hypothetical protein [Pontibacter beigongshangensis]|uniref:hypothetical protein n=1 Tax=Pontibacter beigongshangensis TaxID=2574733 RepID=UPI00165022B6|nr:hypothetical protein [Pontibacter beigongshangensis]